MGGSHCPHFRRSPHGEGEWRDGTSSHYPNFQRLPWCCVVWCFDTELQISENYFSPGLWWYVGCGRSWRLSRWENEGRIQKRWLGPGIRHAGLLHGLLQKYKHNILNKGINNNGLPLYMKQNTPMYQCTWKMQQCAWFSLSIHSIL